MGRVKIFVAECKECGKSIHMGFDGWIHDDPLDENCDPKVWLAYLRGEAPYEDVQWAYPVVFESDDVEKMAGWLIDYAAKEKARKVREDRTCSRCGGTKKVIVCGCKPLGMVKHVVDCGTRAEIPCPVCNPETTFESADEDLLL
jgi:hypothetical protein